MSAHQQDRTEPRTKPVRRPTSGERERAGEPRSFAPSTTTDPAPPEGRLGPAGDPAEGKRDEP